MSVLSPLDRDVIWRDVLTETDPEIRALRRRVMAESMHSLLGSELDVYDERYRTQLVEVFELLDSAGRLDSDVLRQSYDEIDERQGSGISFVATLAHELRALGDSPLGYSERERAVELADSWGEIARSAIHPEEGDDGELLASVADVAALFDVTPQAVYKWVHKEAVEFVQTPGGGAIRLPLRQFEAARGRCDITRLRALERRLLAERGDEPVITDEEIVAEMRSRRRAR